MVLWLLALLEAATPVLAVRSHTALMPEAAINMSNISPVLLQSEASAQGHCKMDIKSIQDYELDTCLGTGNEGEVWGAHPISEPDKFVVLKLFHDSSTAESVRHECSFGQAAKLFMRDKGRGQSITDCIKVDTSAEPPFMIQEVAQGTSLKTYIETRALSTLAEVLSTYLQVLTVLDELAGPASVAGVRYFHMDAHSDNIFLSNNGTVALIDYGNTYMCCSGDAACAPTPFTLAACDASKLEKIQSSMDVAAMTLLIAMLGVPYPDLFGTMQKAQSRFYLNSDENDAAERITKLIRDDFKADWSKLTIGNELLTTGFREAQRARTFRKGVWPVAMKEILESCPRPLTDANLALCGTDMERKVN